MREPNPARPARLFNYVVDWIIRGEPNYLNYAYEIGAGLERKKGAEHEARILEQRRDQLSLRVDGLLATL